MVTHRTSRRLVAFTSIAMFAPTGCATSPQLTAYREGLHQVDAPLYQSHLLLMQDAVKAGLRTATDQQVVQQGINAAEALYQQSVASDGSN